MKAPALSAAFAAALVLAPGLAAEKPKITSQDQLPRFSYEFKGKVTDVATQEAAYQELAPKVRADLEKLLADYDIEDRATRQDVLGALLTMDLHEGRYDAALRRIAEIRVLEQKPAPKLTTGLLAEAYIDARRAAPGDDAAFRAAFRKDYAARLDQLPWEVVGDLIQQVKGSAEIVTEALVLGDLSSQFQPEVDKTGVISGDIAQALVSARVAVAEWLPLKAERVATLAAYVAAHKKTKPDIWVARDVDLTAAQKLTPVIIGIWDSGVDVAVYPHQLWTNPLEQANGKDNDGDGYVADVHGIAFTLHADRTAALLLPLDDAQRAHYPEMRGLTKGLLDIQANIDSPEAAELKRRVAALKPDEVRPFLENINLFGDYTHGTHVAGIAVAGNPAARILVARITFDYHQIPELPTREQSLKNAASYRDVVAYLTAHGARVVNMSWGGSPKDYETALELNGAGGTADERKKLARELFKIERDALYNAMKNAPDILFVVAAGNSDNDVSFDEVLPSGFGLPNMLAVGAVDQAGEETSFTSYGAVVGVDANGYEVESYIPGGERLKYSGTSMASPNVANLAGKLLAIDPQLTVEQVIELIKLGADRSANGRLHLINPKRSLALLRAKLAN
ncbi:MAG TPA: S8 family serine peptidase [Opitutaceae bacterium]|nr:S8 family serine peptidase [Opitutaceae bacterium]